jgi:hypothetical protein
MKGLSLTAKNALRTLREEFETLLYLEGNRDDAGRLVKKIQELGDRAYDDCVEFDLDELREKEAA